MFALSPGSKIPIKGSHGHLDATIDHDEIDRLWREHPDANIGSVNGARVELDVDTHDGKRGDLTLIRLVREHGGIPDTSQIDTPSGGVRYVYRAPFGVRITRRAGLAAPWPAIDLLGHGGYGLMPPSRTRNGVYAWSGSKHIAELSGWLLGAAIKASTPETPRYERPLPGRYGDDLHDRVKRAIAYVDRIGGAISGSGGHDQTYSVALALVRGFELPAAVALDILRSYNSRCKPPWNEQHLTHKIASAERSAVASGYLLNGRTRT